jgi:hypothetical protein
LSVVVIIVKLKVNPHPKEVTNYLKPFPLTLTPTSVKPMVEKRQVLSETNRKWKRPWHGLEPATANMVVMWWYICLAFWAISKCGENVYSKLVVIQYYLPHRVPMLAEARWTKEKLMVWWEASSVKLQSEWIREKKSVKNT